MDDEKYYLRLLALSQYEHILRKGDLIDIRRAKASVYSFKLGMISLYSLVDGFHNVLEDWEFGRFRGVE